LQVKRMTVTPRMSLLGMRLRSGGSASKTNLLTPTGMGPTRRESSSWSYSELDCASQQGGQAVGMFVGLTRWQSRRRAR
ncbi:hypothetical protein KCV07_g421, partial [Aureobasidium melanogenum]